GRKRLMRSSAAASPADSATLAEHRNTSALKINPCSRMARYSQNMERSSVCFSASDTKLLAILGEKLAQPLRLRRVEDFPRRPCFLDQPATQKNHSVAA